MALSPSLLYFLALFCALSTFRAQALVVVTVDPASGNDSSCLSAQEVNESAPADAQTPCKTINRALGDAGCNRNASCVASGQDQLSGVVIRLADGLHQLTGCVGVVQSQNVQFIAENPGGATMTCGDFPSETYNNLQVCSSTNVSFTNIRFENCGPLSPNIFVNYSSGIVFDGCIFTNNTGAVVQMQFSTGVELKNCLFLDNDNQARAEPDVNETTVEELFRTITTGGVFTFFTRNVDFIDVAITNCTFRSNSGNRNNINNSRPVLLKANGHGGAILIRIANVQNSTFRIEDCIFENNSAEVDGGAVFISISRDVSYNQIMLRNNTFMNNRVETASGGAVSINSFNITFNNTITIEDCNFTNNTGNAGGAVSVALYDSNLNSTTFPDAVNFVRCMFINNSAFNEGTAVGLFSLVHVDQVGFPVGFENCLFENNTSLEDNEDTSAVAAFRFPTVFQGRNYFIRNRGGGITLLNTRMQATGKLLFDSNVAVFGAGIAMDDRCLLEIDPGLNMTFYNNMATESGAGIYVEFPPIRFVVDIFNRLCFLQYNNGSGMDYPPQDWTNVTIAFINNRARLSGASIFASDMQQCGWLGNNFTNSTIIFQPPQLLLNNPSYPFQYKNNTLMPEGISVLPDPNQNLATSPSTILIDVKYTLVQPGETLPINLLAVDQVGNSREAVWSLEAPQQDANLDALSAMNDTYPYRVPEVRGLPGAIQGDINNSTGSGNAIDNALITNNNFTSTFNLTFSLLRTLGNTNVLTLSVSGCHPGYVLSSDGTCQCDTTNTAILRCDDNKRYIYLREGIWGGVIMENGARRLVTARVQPGYVNCTAQGRLPGCLFQFDDPDAQCRNGRQGRLCGQCIPDYGVTLDLQSCTSTSCDYGIALFVIFCIFVIVLSTLLLAFNASIPNELKGFFFYAQVIGLVFRPYVVVQSDEVSSVFSSLLNLFGISVPFPLCLSTSPELKAHYVALFGYVSPILVLLPLILYVIGARFIPRLASHSTLKGLTFIFLIVYKYTADTAAIFLSCNDTGSSAYGLVFQYDGSQACASLEFGFFALLGLFLAAVFVIPTPFAISYICVKRPKQFQHYSDVLTEGLRKEHRWWGGWEVGRRLLFVIISYFVVLARPSLILFFMSLAALTVLIVHLFTKPFQKAYINVIEAAILLNLLLVTVAFLDPSNSPVPKEFGLTLVVLPFAYALIFLIYKLCLHIWGRMKVMRPIPDGPTDGKDTAQSHADKAQADTNQSTIKSGLDTTNGTSAIPLTSQRNSREKRTNGNLAGTSPASTNTRPPTLLSPSDDSNIRLREPLLED